MNAFLWWCIIYKPGYFILLALSWSQTVYNNILISLSESSKNFRLSLEFTSGESFRDLIAVFDFRHSWILDPSVPSDPSVRFWIFNTSVVFWILDFGFWTLWFHFYWILFSDFEHQLSNLDSIVRFKFSILERGPFCSLVTKIWTLMFALWHFWLWRQVCDCGHCVPSLNTSFWLGTYMLDFWHQCLTFLRNRFYLHYQENF